MKITAFLILLLCISAFPQEKTKVLRGATIHTVSGGTFENGDLWIKGDKIVYAGPRKDAPADAEITDASGKVIIPGLVDTHSHIGNGDGGDGSSPTQPEVRILDSINPQSDTYIKARAGGITTVNVMPGSGHLISGQTVYLKLRDGKTINDILLCPDEQNGICGGLKMANGTNSIRGVPFPGTRGKSAALLRGIYVKAAEYKKKKESAESPDKMPATDLQMEALLEVLAGKRIVHFHSHRNDDLLTAIRIQKEFGFRMVLHHVSEGWLVADEIAKAKIPCSIIMIDAPGGKLEAVNLLLKNGGILEKAGVNVAIHTDDYITDSRLLLRSGALAVRGGMSEAGALRALTLSGAEMLDLQNRIGSLEKGKDADFVILSGAPFSTYTRVLETWIEGKKVFDLMNPEDRKYSEGGFEVFRNLFYDHVHTEHTEEEK